MEDLLSLSEAAEALNVSEMTVKRYIYAGRLKSYKLPGGRHRIPRSEIQRLLQEGASEPSAEEIVAGLEARVAELEEALEHVTAELQVLAAWLARRQHELPETTTHNVKAKKLIEILGPGCNKCRKLYEITQIVVQESFPEAFYVVHVTDLDRITAYGPLLTPAFVMEGRILSAGRVLTAEEVRGLLQNALRPQ